MNIKNIDKAFDLVCALRDTKHILAYLKMGDSKVTAVTLLAGGITTTLKNLDDELGKLKLISGFIEFYEKECDRIKEKLRNLGVDITEEINEGI